jgi:hypothetical protein
MLRLILTVFTISLLPSTLFADTTVYACKKNGQTTLESVLSKDCDSVKTYHYETFSKDNPNQSSGLRQGEVQQLERFENGPVQPQVQMRRYENVDSRVGWSLANDYVDSRQDKCALYRAMLDRSLSYIGVKNEQDVEIGPYRSAELMTQIEHAQTQVNYYCP